MRRDINFLEAYQIHLKDGNRKIVDGFAGVILVLIIATILGSGLLHFYSIHVESQSVEVFVNLESLKEITEYDYTLYKKSDYESIAQYNSMLKDARQRLESTWAVTLAEYNAIKNNLHDDMGIMSFDFTGDTLVVKIFTSYQESVPEYVASVKNEGIFKHVAYDGHTKEIFSTIITPRIEGEEPQGRYEFTIICILNGGDGGEEYEIE